MSLLPAFQEDTYNMLLELSGSLFDDRWLTIKDVAAVEEDN